MSDVDDILERKHEVTSLVLFVGTSGDESRERGSPCSKRNLFATQVRNTMVADPDREADRRWLDRVVQASLNSTM